MHALPPPPPLVSPISCSQIKISIIFRAWSRTEMVRLDSNSCSRSTLAWHPISWRTNRVINSFPRYFLQRLNLFDRKLFRGNLDTRILLNFGTFGRLFARQLQISKRKKIFFLLPFCNENNLSFLLFHNFYKKKDRYINNCTMR